MSDVQLTSSNEEAAESQLTNQVWSKAVLVLNLEEPVQQKKNRLFVITL